MNIDQLQCVQFQDHVNKLYEENAYWERSVRNVDPVVAGAAPRVATSARQQADLNIGKNNALIHDYIQRGLALGCQRMGLTVGPSAGQIAAGQAQHCARLAENLAYHQGRIQGTVAPVGGPENHTDMVARLTQQMRQYNCAPPR